MGRDRYWSRSFRKTEKESPGCMSTVLQLFDFHQFQYSTQQQQQKQTFNTDTLVLDPPFLKEAPRNSLELEGDLFTTKALASVAIEEDDIPIGISMVTCHPNSMEKDSLSDTSSLQGSRTPNLVARLMGLDLLPDQVYSPKIQSRPSPSRLKSHQSPKPLQIRDTNFALMDSRRHEMGTRSLPDTPRISSARRSDVDPRLSLQLNKENIDIIDFSYSPFSSRKGGKTEGKFYYEEKKSSSRYARESAKQVKESVSRRVGLDITNITTNNRFRNKCSNENDALTFSIRKTRRTTSKSSDETSPSKHTPPSCSPRLRFLDSKTKPTESKDQSKPSSKPPRPSPSPLSSMMLSSPSRECTKNKSEPLPRLAIKRKKASCERFTQRSKKPAASIEKKCKDIRIHAPPPSTISQIRTQTQEAVPLQLSRTSSPSYELQPLPLLDDRDDSRTTVTAAAAAAANFRYVREILQRTGLHRDTLVSFTTWFSPAHPVDPSIFHHLELSFDRDRTCRGPLKHRCNRRLLFNLIDEILRDALWPYLNMRPWARAGSVRPPSKKMIMTGEQLLQQLSSRVGGFPSANCQTLEDIDALVEKDLVAVAGGANMSWGAQEEEAVESVVVEVEREIVNSLVHEAMLLLLLLDGCCC